MDTRPSMDLFTAAWHDRDLDALAGLYAEDGRVVTPEGHDVAAADVADFFRDGLASIDVVFTTAFETTSGDLHIERGHVRDTARVSGDVVETCTYVAVWIRIDDHWKILHHSWNGPLAL